VRSPRERGSIAWASRIFLWPVFVIVLAAIAVDFGNRPQAIGIDFHTYLAAARVGLGQGWSHIYEQAVIARQQAFLVPNEHVQPFLSTPPVAWLVATLAALPYAWAYSAWAMATISALAGAVVWSASGGWAIRALAALLVIAPVWVLQADYLGQVMPLVAAAVVVAWRLARANHDVAAGLVLALVLLKPNTAFVVPIALAVSGRYRAFVTWSIATTAVAGVALLTVGTHGLEAYASQLQHPPPGTNAVTLEAALGDNGFLAVGLRMVILCAVVASAWRLRTSPGLVIALGVLGSLLATPYLHVCDLCLLAAAGWIVWEERPTWIWRAPLAATWLIASPFVDVSGLGPTQNRWPLFELAWLVAVVAIALWPRSFPSRLLANSQSPVAASN
jgi:hypothetical protein